MLCDDTAAAVAEGNFSTTKAWIDRLHDTFDAPSVGGPVKVPSPLHRHLLLCLHGVDICPRIQVRSIVGGCSYILSNENEYHTGTYCDKPESEAFCNSASAHTFQLPTMNDRGKYVFPPPPPNSTDGRLAIRIIYDPVEATGRRFQMWFGKGTPPRLPRRRHF